MVQVSEYSSVAAAGNVNVLFWIRNVGTSACFIRGYVSASYIGEYGLHSFPLRHPQKLVVPSSRRVGSSGNGNDVGGIASGKVSTVVLATKGYASFWLYGNDEPIHLRNDQTSRCITSNVMKVTLPGQRHGILVSTRSDSGYFWCGGVVIHPVVQGRSGTLPATPLEKFFGG